jgi:hypothetical protein
VAADLRRRGVKETRRRGLPAEAVLRCGLLKQHRQLSYQELASHLQDPASFRAFARLPWPWSPRKSVLHQTISAIQAETWEQVNRALLGVTGSGLRIQLAIRPTPPSAPPQRPLPAPHQRPTSAPSQPCLPRWNGP